jgi:hypothetical protein
MKKIAIIITIWFAFQQNGAADIFHDYIEYRYQPKLGKITILSSFVRSAEYADYVSDDWEELAKENIFVHGAYHTGEKRVFERSNTIGKYKIDTILTLYPPEGPGMGGALPTTYLQVTINGKKKIDCNIGYFPGGNEEVEHIMICPEDDAIFIKAFDRVKSEKICDRFIAISDPEIVTNEYIKETR